MMNLLVMPVWRAERIDSEWNSSSIPIVCSVIGILGFIIAIIGIGGVLSSILDTTVEGYHFKWKQFLAVVCMFVVGTGAVVSFYKMSSAEMTQDKAVQNVKDYHEMHHLKNIYPKLPCKPQIERNNCASKSLAKASKNKRTATHVFTKHKAIKKYNKILARYRNDGKGGNGTKSITPRAPRISDCL